MNIFAKEIQRGAEESGIKLTYLSQGKTQKFWEDFRRLLKVNLDDAIWDQISYDINTLDPDGWKRASSMVEAYPTYFFCEHYQNPLVYIMKSKEDLDALLSETFHFIFYLIDVHWRKLIVFDNHDCLRVKNLR